MFVDSVIIHLKGQTCRYARAIFLRRVIYLFSSIRTFTNTTVWGLQWVMINTFTNQHRLVLCVGFSDVSLVVVVLPSTEAHISCTCI